MAESDTLLSQPGLQFQPDLTQNLSELQWVQDTLPEFKFMEFIRDMTQNQIHNHDLNNKIPGKSFCIIGQNYGIKQVIFNVLICLWDPETTGLMGFLFLFLLMLLGFFNH